MHVTLFITSLGTGGTQRQVVALASGLQVQGVEVSTVVVYPGGAFWDRARDQGLACKALYSEKPRLRIFRALGAIWAPVKLRKLTRNSEPDVLYSMLDWSNLIARLALLGMRRKPLQVWGVRASALQQGLRARMANRLCRSLSAGVPLVIANSASGLELLRLSGFQVARGEVVHNGIDSDQFQFNPDARSAVRQKWGIGEDQLFIVLVGRRDARKGHEQFVAAARQLSAENETFHFACIGPGTAESLANLERQVSDTGMSDKLRIFDEADDMVAVYSAADIVVSASSSEGFPNVIGEAMSCGGRCVATDVGDSAALVGDCGVIVPPGDAGALAQGISDASAMPAELGDRARARIAEKFSIQNLTRKTLRLFDDD
jgi:glycosyltransferase involved in cell wall biosynthesis